MEPPLRPEGEEPTATEAAGRTSWLPDCAAAWALSKESSTARYVHVDNLGVITSLPRTVDVVQQRWVEAFESRELHFHKSAVSSTVELGLEGCCCRTTRGRLMGLRAGLRSALDSGMLAGWQLEAPFHRCFKFRCHSYALEVPIWSEVAAGLQCFRGL